MSYLLMIILSSNTTASHGATGPQKSKTHKGLDVAICCDTTCVLGVDDSISTFGYIS